MIFGRAPKVKTESVTRILIPVEADHVLSPEVHYGAPITAIYFQTPDNLFGRITFYNLDSLKVCRGEYMPYTHDPNIYKDGCWVFKIENSKWLTERFKYESGHYGKAYQFNGDVNEMATDFSHYLFAFHDEFVEAIAKGFWFEKDTRSLIGRELMENHPFLPLPEEGVQKITANNLTCQVRINKNPVDELIANAAFCPQTLFEFALELDGKASVGNTVTLTSKNGKLTSTLRGYFGNKIIDFDGVVSPEQVIPYIENHMGEVHERRKKMGKV